MCLLVLECHHSQALEWKQLCNTCMHTQNTFIHVFIYTYLHPCHIYIEYHKFTLIPVTSIQHPRILSSFSPYHICISMSLMVRKLYPIIFNWYAYLINPSAFNILPLLLPSLQHECPPHPTLTSWLVSLYVNTVITLVGPTVSIRPPFCTDGLLNPARLQHSLQNFLLQRHPGTPFTRKMWLPPIIATDVYFVLFYIRIKIKLIYRKGRTREGEGKGEEWGRAETSFQDPIYPNILLYIGNIQQNVIMHSHLNLIMYNISITLNVPICP